MRGRVIICPNPECHKKIEEPILLNNLSTTPAEQYHACPRCFIKLNAYVTRANLAGLFLTAFGSIILAWVGWLTWYDMTMWGKDIALIFFGSRTGEAISLGIGIKVIYYSLIGLALLILGLCTFIRRRSKAAELHLSAIAPEKEKDPSKCPHHFGYLKKFDQNTSIPNECLSCSRILECFGFMDTRVQHIMVIPEERWCLEKYGNAYREYMNRTPKWIEIPKSRNVRDLG